ncbi:hypothetical protein CKAH01_04887 [Colletotrichum kahawae]|uniref:Uncharacterized protein n=1 Tax=Colletotrichum kahawae TaxID=34407 RepID=A0AAE0D6G5_COLKA|nr:hypothetical protein CKAH01_04887 [Colletotrichum kahawae]
MAKAAWTAMAERREGRWEPRGEATPMAKDSTSCPCRPTSSVSFQGRFPGALRSSFSPFWQRRSPEKEEEARLPDTNTYHTKKRIPCICVPRLLPLVPGAWPSSEVAEWKISNKSAAASLLLPSTGESTPRPPTTGAEEPPTRALLAKQYEALALDASEAHDTSSATVRGSP